MVNRFSFAGLVGVFVGLLLAVSGTSARAFTLSDVGFEGAWPGNTVAFYYNDANCPAGVSDALKKAYDTWSNIPSSNLKVKSAGTSTITPAQLVGGSAGTNVPVIVCDTNFGTTSPSVDPESVGGYGFFTHQGGKIVYGGIVLNVQSGKRNNINTYSATQLAILMTHEMGHVLGLGHSEYVPALMYYDISLKKAFNLAQDDIDGISYLYPRDELKDGVYGCGRMDADFLPPGAGPLALILLLIPIALLLTKRYQLPFPR